jgi:hypothetical protein
LVQIDSENTEGCGKPIYVERICANPTYERDWPAAVKRKVFRTAGKFEGIRRARYARNNSRKDIDFNHVVASPPEGFAVDSENPLERTLLVLKTLPEEHWTIEEFVVIPIHIASRRNIGTTTSARFENRHRCKTTPRLMVHSYSK